MKVHYAKPYLTIDGQIDLLASRGLRIKDRLVARDLLTGVNYYRLTGYAIPFSIDREHFKKGATLSDLIAVYLFDRKARDILSEALEAIELGFRAAFCRAFAEGLGPLCYRDAANFKSVQTFKGTLARIDAEIIRSNEPYIQHFRANYLADEIPMAVVPPFLSCFADRCATHRGSGISPHQRKRLAFLKVVRRNLTFPHSPHFLTSSFSHSHTLTFPHYT